MVIARAAAQIRRQRVAQFRIRRRRVIAQKSGERHQKAGRAEAALQPVGLTERTLKWIQIAVWSGERFDGANVVSIGLYGEHDTGADWFTVEQDGTRAADAMLTSNMGAGETEVLPDEIAEHGPSGGATSPVPK